MIGPLGGGWILIGQNNCKVRFPSRPTSLAKFNDARGPKLGWRKVWTKTKDAYSTYRLLCCFDSYDNLLLGKVLTASR